MRRTVQSLVFVATVGPACTDLLYPVQDGPRASDSDDTRTGGSLVAGRPAAPGSEAPGGDWAGDGSLGGVPLPSSGGATTMTTSDGHTSPETPAGGDAGGGQGGSDGCPLRDDFESLEVYASCWVRDEVPKGNGEAFEIDPIRGKLTIHPTPNAKFSSGKGASNLQKELNGDFIATAALSLYGPDGASSPDSVGAAGAGIALFMGPPLQDGLYADYYFVKVVTGNAIIGNSFPVELTVGVTVGNFTGISPEASTKREAWVAPEAWRYSELRLCRRGSLLQFLARAGTDADFGLLYPATASDLSGFDLASPVLPNPTQSELTLALLGELGSEAEPPRVEFDWFELDPLSAADLADPNVCFRMN